MQPQCRDTPDADKSAHRHKLAAEILGVGRDHRGGVHITYSDSFFIADRHNVQGQDMRLEAIAGALLKFALIGAGKDPN